MENKITKIGRSIKTVENLNTQETYMSVCYSIMPKQRGIYGREYISGLHTYTYIFIIN